jgi:hypothetical protein
MFESELEGRVERALHVTPVTSRERTKRAIMQRVRGSAPERGVLPIGAGRLTRSSIIGLALAAGIGSITTISALQREPRSQEAAALSSDIIGDSVVNRLRDTLRLVRLMFNAPSARQVAIVGDFNNWNLDATPMKRDEGSGKWSVTVALHAGDHRYAIVVDNTRLPVANRNEASATESYALLRVAATN